MTGKNTNKTPHPDDDHVTCLICGKELASLSFHLANKHGVSAQEYKDEYGVDYIISKNLRLDIARRVSKDGKAKVKADTREALLDAIRKLAVNGTPPTQQAFFKHSPGLATQACYIFGSWNDALAEAGLTPRPKMKWTPQRVKNQIKERYSAGRSLHYSDMIDDDIPLYKGAIERFGTWKSAVAAAGIDYDALGYKSVRSGEELREELLQWISVNGPVSDSLLKASAPKLHASLLNRYGSTSRGTKELGLSHEKRLTEWTVERIREAFSERKRKGLSLKLSVIKKDDPALRGALQRKFATRAEVIEAVGEPHDSLYSDREWNSGDLETELRKWSDEHGPLKGPLLKKTRPDLYYRIFAVGKKLDQIAKELNLPYTSQRKSWTRELVLAELANLQKKGIQLRSESVRKNAPALFRACLRKFGSFKNAIKHFEENN